MVGDSHHANRLRILQVIGAMKRAGVETWLMRVLRAIDRDRFEISFLVHTDEEGELEEEIRDLGSTVYRQTVPKRSLSYAASLKRLLVESGPWHSIHSHEHQFSGVILRAAEGAGIRQRIAHCHNDTSLRDGPANLPRYLYRKVMTSLVWNHGTHGIACSELAAPSVFGEGWRQFPHMTILPCGIVLDDFSRAPDSELRTSLGLPASRRIVGHVGRFEPQKNHALIVEVAEIVRTRNLPYHFLLVGDGTLKPSILQMIAERGLQEWVTILPNRPDIATLMRGAMDSFIFPSNWEGLGVVLLEAQASLLPCLLSSRVPVDANLFPSGNAVCDPAGPAAHWVDALIQLQPVPLTEMRNRIDTLKSSPFNITSSLVYLQRVYGEAA